MALIRLGLVFGSSQVAEGRRLLFSTQSDLDIVLEESDGQLAIESLSEAAVDVVLMDVRLKSLSGLETAARFFRRNVGSGERLPRFILTGPFSSDQFTLDAVRAGASAVVTEDQTAEELLDWVRRLASKEFAVDNAKWFGFFEAQGLVRGDNPRWLLRLAALEPKHRQAFDLLCAGLNEPEIAVRLKLSATSTRWAIEEVMRSLGVASRPQLALAAYEAVNPDAGEN
ncbi:MAG: response regulator [Micrococcales bacterium]